MLPWNWPSFRSVPAAGSQRTWLTLRDFAPALNTGQLGFGSAAPLSWRMLPARNTTHFVDDPADIYSGRLGNPETLAWNNCSTKWRCVQSRVGTVTPIAPLSPAAAQSPIALLSLRQLAGIRHANSRRFAVLEIWPVRIWNRLAPYGRSQFVSRSEKNWNGFL